MLDARCDIELMIYVGLRVSDRVMLWAYVWNLCVVILVCDAVGDVCGHVRNVDRW